jgi:hypothetical protein
MSETKSTDKVNRTAEEINKEYNEACAKFGQQVYQAEVAYIKELQRIDALVTEFQSLPKPTPEEKKSSETTGPDTDVSPTGTDSTDFDSEPTGLI